MTFEEYVHRRTGALLGLAVAVSGDRHVAEDVVQDVLVKAHARWAAIEQLDDPHAYVRRMVVNEHLSWRRKWSRVVPFAEVALFDDRPDDASRHADRAALIQALRTLTGRQRTVLALRFYEGLSDREIAEVLGCGEGSVRTHASRALAALRTKGDQLLTMREATS